MEEGEGRTNWESSIDIYTLQSVKQMAAGKLLHGTGISAPRCVMTQRVGWDEGWEGGSRGTGVYAHI